MGDINQILAGLNRRETCIRDLRACKANTSRLSY